MAEAMANMTAAEKAAFVGTIQKKMDRKKKRLEQMALKRAKAADATRFYAGPVYGIEAGYISPIPVKRSLNHLTAPAQHGLPAISSPLNRGDQSPSTRGAEARAAGTWSSMPSSMDATTNYSKWHDSYDNSRGA